MMRQRLISAAVLVPLVVIVFLAGQPWLSIGIAVLAALAGYETAQLVRRAGLSVSTPLAVALPPLAVLAFVSVIGPFENVVRPRSFDIGWLLVGPALAIWGLLAAVAALRDPDPANGFRRWAGTIFAGLYPSLLAFVAGLAIMDWEIQFSEDHSAIFDTGRAWLVILVASVWALDTFAYLTGRFLPRGRFMSHISPNKTWSGAIGGAIAAVVIATVLGALLVPEIPLIGLVLGITIAITAQAGDLAESMLKRAAGAKDSGSLVPGHGGILDRLDSFLFAAPAAYAVVVLVAILDPNVV